MQAMDAAATQALATIETSLCNSEVALQKVVSMMLESQAQGGEPGALSSAQLGSALAALSDDIAQQRKARTGMLARLKVGAAPGPPPSPAREAQGAKPSWELRTLQRVRAMMLREVTKLQQDDPVDEERVAAIHEDIRKISGKLGELMAGGTPPLRAAAATDKIAAGQGIAKPSDPSPTITPPADPDEVNAGHTATPQQNPAPSARPSSAWESPLVKLLEAISSPPQPARAADDFQHVISKIMSGPTPRKEAAAPAAEEETDASATPIQAAPSGPAPDSPGTAGTPAAFDATIVGRPAAPAIEAGEGGSNAPEADSPLPSERAAAVRIQAVHRGRQQRLLCRRRLATGQPQAQPQATVVRATTLPRRSAAIRRQLDFPARSQQDERRVAADGELPVPAAPGPADGAANSTVVAVRAVPMTQVRDEPEQGAAVQRGIETTAVAAAQERSHVITLMVSVLSHNGTFQKRQKLSGVISGGRITDIKTLIEKRAGLATSAQRLRLDDGSTPTDEATLQELGLVDGSHIALLRPPPRSRLQQSAPSAAAPVVERSSSSGSDRAASAFVPVGSAGNTKPSDVTATPTRPVRATQSLAARLMMSPMLSPIRATGEIAADGPQFGGAGFAATALEERDGHGAEEGEEGPEPGQEDGVNWPAPTSAIARSISEQIDSSSAALEFEAQVEDEARESQALDSSGAAALAEAEASAIRIQAMCRGRAVRAHLSMRPSAICTAVKPAPADSAMVVVVEDEPAAAVANGNPIRRQLQFDAPAAGARAQVQLEVDMPPEEFDDGSSPFSPSPFDGEHVLASVPDAPPDDATSPPSPPSNATEGSTDSFSPSSAGSTPPKPAEAGAGLALEQVSAGPVPDVEESPSKWGGLTVENDPRHLSPGTNRFRLDQAARRAQKAKRREKKGQTAKGAAGREKEAAPKTHKLSDVVKALWPRWVDQFGLVTGPSSMGIVNAKQDDLSLEPWRGDSDMEDDEWRCWVWDDDAAS